MHMELTQLNSLERDLSESLRPIDPDPDFIRTLSRRLVRPDRTILGRSNSPRKIWAVIGLGLIIGVLTLLLLTGREKD